MSKISGFVNIILLVFFRLIEDNLFIFLEKSVLYSSFKPYQVKTLHFKTKISLVFFIISPGPLWANIQQYL